MKLRFIHNPWNFSSFQPHDMPVRPTVFPMHNPSPQKITWHKNNEKCFKCKVWNNVSSNAAQNQILKKQEGITAKNLQIKEIDTGQDISIAGVVEAYVVIQMKMESPLRLWPSFFSVVEAETAIHKKMPSPMRTRLSLYKP